MHKTLKMVVIGIFICVWSCTVYGQEVTREQIKGLDEQVQEIKSDVLSIATQLHQLEEKLQNKNEVVAELLEEHIKLKKASGGL